MSTRRFASLTSVAAAAAIAACYGSGPEPTAPSSAKVLWRTPAGNGSCTSLYVGPVALGSSKGYTIALPYAQSGCFSIMRDVSVTEFPLDGTSPDGLPFPQGQSGTVSGDTTHIFGPEPQLAASGSAVAIVYLATGEPMIGPTQSQISLSDGSGSAAFIFQPAAIAFDGSALYAAVPTNSTEASVDPFSPLFPPAVSQLLSNVVGGLWRIDLPPPTNAQATLHWLADATFSCGELEHCLVANATSLFHIGLTPAGDSIVTINSVPKAGGVSSVIATVPSSLVGAKAVPVGLIADDTRVVLVMANAPTTNNNGAIEPGCWVFSHDLALAPAPMTPAFQTTEVSCMGAALDATHVYFAAVHSGDPTCNGCTPPVHGDGIARVSLDAANTFESIAFDIAGPSAGPRRVYLSSPDTLIVVSPSVIASVPTDVFPRRHDLTP